MFILAVPVNNVGSRGSMPANSGFSGGSASNCGGDCSRSTGMNNNRGGSQGNNCGNTGVKNSNARTIEEQISVVLRE